MEPAGIFVVIIVLLAYFRQNNIAYPDRGMLRLAAFILSTPLEKNIGYLLNSTVFDTFDCASLITGRKCDDKGYQAQDKLTDNLIRLYYLLQKPHWYLWLAYIYRTVGEILYWNGFIQRSGFVAFPDLYQVLYFADIFPNHQHIYLPVAIGAKMTQEVYLHLRKKPDS